MALKSRIPAAKASITQEADRLVLRIANQVRNNAVKLVQQGSRSGRVYKRGNITHQASAPGEPPKTDTGILVRSIRVEHRSESGEARVAVGAEYGRALEFGTPKMAARPFLRPAANAVRQQMPEIAKSVRIKIEK